MIINDSHRDGVHACLLVTSVPIAMACRTLQLAYAMCFFFSVFLLNQCQSVSELLIGYRQVAASGLSGMNSSFPSFCAHTGATDTHQ